MKLRGKRKENGLKGAKRRVEGCLRKGGREITSQGGGGEHSGAVTLRPCDGGGGLYVRNREPRKDDFKEARRKEGRSSAIIRKEKRNHC